MSVRDFHLISTEDGTYSLYSEEYGQAMHSLSGAYREAVKKHIIPSKLLALADKEIFVLDIGFGMGFNILALIYEFLSKKNNQKLNIISLEKDFSHIPLLKEITFNDERKYIYKNILNAVMEEESGSGSYTIKIIRGDARDAIKKLDNNFFDAVFHDPFSPSKNPELWTVDFFKEVNRTMKNSAILTTYSSAMHIRRSLMEAGFIIGKGPSVGRKREGTLASKSECINGFSKDEITELLLNYKSVPYVDESLNSPREKILEQRIMSIREIRKGNSY